MAEIWPSAGLDLILDIFPRGGAVPANSWLGLFTAFTATTVGSRTQGSTTDYTEPGSGAYARQTIANNTTNWPTKADYQTTLGRQVACLQQTFPTATGSWGSLNGFFLCAGAATGAQSVYFAANFDDGAAVPINTNDIIKVTPVIAYGH
jgi:hypothetical protein